jgi:pantoate kinase
MDAEYKEIVLEIPLHVTGFWVPIWRSEPLLSGSLGAGLLLEPRVIVEAKLCDAWDIEIRVGGKVLRAKPSLVNEIIKNEALHPACIRIRSPVPLGSGFAVSAAIALGVSLGSGLLSGLGLVESASLAHRAEVVAGTGLGDVVAMIYGRWLEARLSAGGPGLVRVESYSAPEREVAAVVLGEMSTSDMHRLLGERIIDEGSRAFAHFIQSPSLRSFFEQSRCFSRRVGMVSDEDTELFERLKSRMLIEDWYVKKKVAIILPRRGKEEEAFAELRDHYENVYRLRITGSGIVATFNG